MIRKPFNLIVVIVMLFAGCKKEEPIINPPMPDEPYIEIRSTSSVLLRPLKTVLFLLFIMKMEMAISDIIHPIHFPYL